MSQRINADWSAIRLGYLNGDTFPTLAKVYGIKEPTIRSRASREKWHLPPKRALHRPEEATVALQKAHELWQIRKERVKESEFVISERILRAAETMAEDQLINKADKIKIGVDMGRRSVGLDVEEKKENAVNIAILGEIDSRTLAGMSYDAVPAPALPEADAIVVASEPDPAPEPETETGENL
jgi:hypothetical protein